MEKPKLGVKVKALWKMKAKPLCREVERGGGGRDLY